ncbi:MAG: hypothetical protein FD167_5711, partial [bacterium]
WQNGMLIDSHSQPTNKEVWQLMKRVVELTNLKGTILERDENLPVFTELVKELAQARTAVFKNLNSSKSSKEKVLSWV